MSLWRQSSRIYCDFEDVDIATRLLAKRIADGEPDDFRRGVYCGVHFVLNQMMVRDRMDMGPTFMGLLDGYLDGAWDIDGTADAAEE